MGEILKISDVWDKEEEKPKKIDFWKEADERYATRLETGIKLLDEATSGLHRGEINIIAGRPGEGKTTMALQFAMKWALEGKKVLFFSCEMPKQKLMAKMASHMFHINSKDILNGNIPFKERAEIDIFFEAIEKSGLKIIDNIVEVTSLGIALEVDEHDPDVFIIDHLQMMGSDARIPFHQQIKDFIMDMKILLNRKKSVALFISHVARKAEERKHYMPKPSDLSESGSIEKLADSIMLLSWPWKYQQFARLMEKQDTPETYNKNEFYIDLAKNRYGEPGAVKIKFTPEDGRFEDDIFS